MLPLTRLNAGVIIVPIFLLLSIIVTVKSRSILNYLKLVVALSPLYLIFYLINDTDFIKYNTKWDGKSCEFKVVEYDNGSIYRGFLDKDNKFRGYGHFILSQDEDFEDDYDLEEIQDSKQEIKMSLGFFEPILNNNCNKVIKPKKGTIKFRKTK